MALPRLLIGVQGNTEFDVCLPAAETGAENEGTDVQTIRIIQLYDELRLPVFRYLICLGVLPHEAEEIVQESFLRAFQHLTTRNEQGGNLRAWIFRVAHNLAVNIRKKNRRYGSLNLISEDFANPIVDKTPSVEDQLLEKEKFSRLCIVIDSLSAQQRQYIALRAEGLRYREIAEITGVSISAVAECVHRAYKKLAG